MIISITIWCHSVYLWNAYSEMSFHKTTILLTEVLH